ncbi:hypothetical protein Misp01_09950 [Microtetraspora sp. NBRC 13810]|nr:hypothetical protein Misp01_09950 [Microtetraspora sp. NBRC 13810]
MTAGVLADRAEPGRLRGARPTDLGPVTRRVPYRADLRGRHGTPPRLHAFQQPSRPLDVREVVLRPGTFFTHPVSHPAPGSSHRVKHSAAERHVVDSGGSPSSPSPLANRNRTGRPKCSTVGRLAHSRPARQLTRCPIPDRPHPPAIRSRDQNPVTFGNAAERPIDTEAHAVSPARSYRDHDHHSNPAIFKQPDVRKQGYSALSNG